MTIFIFFFKTKSVSEWTQLRGSQDFVFMFTMTHKITQSLDLCMRKNNLNKEILAITFKMSNFGILYFPHFNFLTKVLVFNVYPFNFLKKIIHLIFCLLKFNLNFSELNKFKAQALSFLLFLLEHIILSLYFSCKESKFILILFLLEINFLD